MVVKSVLIIQRTHSRRFIQLIAFPMLIENVGQRKDSDNQELSQIQKIQRKSITQTAHHFISSLEKVMY